VILPDECIEKIKEDFRNMGYGKMTITLNGDGTIYIATERREVFKVLTREFFFEVRILWRKNFVRGQVA
jgi:hypothetical protein